MKEKTHKKILIAFEDAPDGSFKIGFEGDVQRIGKLKPQMYSPAEFWAQQFMEAGTRLLGKQKHVQKIDAPALVKGN